MCVFLFFDSVSLPFELHAKTSTHKKMFLFPCSICVCLLEKMHQKNIPMQANIPDRQAAMNTVGLRRWPAISDLELL